MGAWQGQAPAGSREGDVHLPGQTGGKEPGPKGLNQHGCFLEGIRVNNEMCWREKPSLPVLVIYARFGDFFFFKVQLSQIWKLG